MDNQIKKIAVIGAGSMGWQIALHCAVKGYPVCLIDIAEQMLDQARKMQIQEIERLITQKQIIANEKDVILRRLNFTSNMRQGVSDVDLVIETVSENLELKRRVFEQLDQFCPSYTILATNSSSIPISQIESAVQRTDKVLNTHFYPPIWARPMVELMGGAATSDDTIKKVKIFVYSIALTPLIVKTESKGFIFNRVWRAIKRECLHLVNEGVSSFEDVDRAWMICFNLPYGPFGLMDMVGLDVVRDIEMSYYKESNDPKDAPPQLLLDKIAKGELGIKTNKGFYKYPNPDFQDFNWLKGEKNNEK